MASGKWLSLVSKKQTVKMAAGALLGMGRAQEPLLTFERLYLLERSLKGAGLEIDWTNV
jgi:hypothetical protein